MVDTAPRWIEYMTLAELVPAKRNAKRHADDDIAASIKRFGVIELQVLDERTRRLVSGHGRLDVLAAAEQAGLEPPDGVVVRDDGVWTVPVTRGWRSRNDKEAEAAIVTVNRLVERGGWDIETLAASLEHIGSSRAGFDGVGYDRDDLDDMLAELAGPDAVPGWDGASDPDDGYTGSGNKELVLAYPTARFDRVARLCQELRRKRGVDTNADLVELLLTDAAAADGIKLGDD